MNLFHQDLASSKSLIKRKSTSGILIGLENLLSEHKLQLKKLLIKTRQENFQITDASKVKSFKIHPIFMQSISLYSNPSYLEIPLLQKETVKKTCLFYSFLEQDLYKYAQGRIKEILINYIDTEGIDKTTVMQKKTFFNLLYKKECFKTREQNILFTPAHFKKTIDKLNFKTQKTQRLCENQFESLKTHPMIAHFCHIHEKIQIGKKAKLNLAFLDESKNSKKVFKYNLALKKLRYYKKNISYYKRNFISNLCTNLNSSINFCAPFLKDDFWTKILNGEFPNYKIDYKCRDSLNKKGHLTAKEREKCARTFLKKDNFCTNHGNKINPSLFPMPKCRTTELALRNSNLVSKYHDCPSLVDNESITNINRIIMHINEKEVKTTKNSCAGHGYLNYFNMFQIFKKDKKWPLEICFFNKVSDKEVCSPYIPGENSKTYLSETQVISNILSKTQSGKFDIKCKLETKKNYNPAKLKYKSGCFLIFKKSDCTTMHCPKKIILDKKEMTNIKYQGQLLFDYIPNTFNGSTFSSINILEKVYKRRSRPIINLTELKYYFKQKKKGILHGIGCAEDIHPSFYKKISLNQCRPIPFIIDGVIGNMLSLRSAISDLHSPDLIHWSLLFGSVSAYKNIHPLKTWALYGLY